MFCEQTLRPCSTPVNAKKTHKLAVIFQQEGNKKSLHITFLCFCTKYVIVRRLTRTHTHTLRKCRKGQTLELPTMSPPVLSGCTIQYLQCRVFVTSSVSKVKHLKAPALKLAPRPKSVKWESILIPRILFGVCSNCFLTWILYWKTLWYRPRFLFLFSFTR